MNKLLIGQKVRFIPRSTGVEVSGTVVGLASINNVLLSAMVSESGRFHPHFITPDQLLESVVDTANIPAVKNLRKLIDMANGECDDNDFNNAQALIYAYPDLPLEEIILILYNGDYDIMTKPVDWDDMVNNYIHDELGLTNKQAILVNRDLVINKLKSTYIETPFGFISVDEDVLKEINS